MSGIYQYIANTIGYSSSHSQEPEDSFHLFSSLPAELRRKIWHFALPSRIIEASLNFEDEAWSCAYIVAKPGMQDRRHLPELFSVCVESREFCLEQYVPFANAYIHPTLDILYVSWYWLLPNPEMMPKFYPLQNQPFTKMHTVAISIGRNNNFASRFGAFVNCLRQLGAPEEVLLCLVGPRLPSLFSNTAGFSISNGNKVVLLDWQNKVEEDMSQEVGAHVMRALEEEKATDPSFNIPEVSKRLYYIYSGP